MTIQDDIIVVIETPTGPMRTNVFRPAAGGRYPGVILYSEIFQVTGPIRRTAAMIAGNGYVVAVPEVYHELEPAGRVLAYDQSGADIGNAHKYAKSIGAYDSDAQAAIRHLLGRDDCTNKIGVMGVCLGGHLAFRSGTRPAMLRPGVGFVPPEAEIADTAIHRTRITIG